MENPNNVPTPRSEYQCKKNIFMQILRNDSEIVFYLKQEIEFF